MTAETTRPPLDIYEEREMTAHLNALDALRSAPLDERKEAEAEWLDALTECADHGIDSTLIERANWLFEGAYGYGARVVARRIAANPRLNQTAGIGQLLAAVEWMCPDRHARSAWAKLSPQQQAQVTIAIATAIAEAKTTIEAGA